MNNCDVFILISILIVVLLLIYNRNKRDKQIEGFDMFGHPHKIGDKNATHLEDIARWAVYDGGIGHSWFKENTDFDSLHDWLKHMARGAVIEGGMGVDGKGGKYYKSGTSGTRWSVHSKTKELAGQQVWSQLDTPHNEIHYKIIKSINDTFKGDNSDASTHAHFTALKEHIKKLARQDTTAYTEGQNFQNYIKGLVPQGSQNNSSSTSHSDGEIKELADKQFDKKFSSLQGATIQLNTSGIKCMKDGRTITCPDSIQPSGGSSGTGSGSAATSTGYTTHNNRACNPSGEIIQNESHTTYNSAKQACNTMSGCQGVQRFGGVYQLKSTVTGHKSNENHAYTCYKKN
jgi:hypothetical protein